MTIHDSDRILIVAPHADDESIGAGGFLSKYGKQCDVWLMTDGRKGNAPDNQYTERELISIRKEEFKQVMAFFNVHEYTFLELTDGSVSSEVSRIYNKNIKEYDYIFVPNKHEEHPDHIATYKAIMKMKKMQRAKGDIIEYEVWTPLLTPNIYLPVTECFNCKLRALSHYKSQLKTLDYISLAESLNRYRGFASNEKYREAFFSHRQDFIERKNHIASRLPKLICVVASKMHKLKKALA